MTVADCELAIARGDVEGALKKLRRIPNTSPHYVKARMAMADIYLRHRKDKTAYIKCYMDLVVRRAAVAMPNCEERFGRGRKRAMAYHSGWVTTTAVVR